MYVLGAAAVIVDHRLIGSRIGDWWLVDDPVTERIVDIEPAGSRVDRSSLVAPTPLGSALLKRISTTLALLDTSRARPH